MESLFVDTSAWYAFLSKSDRDHAAVARFLHEFEGRLLTSNYIFDEAITLCRRRLGFVMAGTLGTALLDSSVVEMIYLTPEDQAEAWRLFLARRDKVYSFTDCTSFVLMRRLGLDSALALDADFEQEGFQTFPAA